MGWSHKLDTGCAVMLVVYMTAPWGHCAGCVLSTWLLWAPFNTTGSCDVSMLPGTQQAPGDLLSPAGLSSLKQPSAVPSGAACWPKPRAVSGTRGLHLRRAALCRGAPSPPTLLPAVSPARHRGKPEPACLQVQCCPKSSSRRWQWGGESLQLLPSVSCGLWEPPSERGTGNFPARVLCTWEEGQQLSVLQKLGAVC